MNDFEFEINYRDEIINIEGYVSTIGYTHKIILHIKGFEVTLEPDEERNYRAIILRENANTLPATLIALVVEEIENNLK